MSQPWPDPPQLPGPPRAVATIERPADTRALVDAAQAGDRQAFGALYEHYHDVVFRFIYHRVGNRPLTEDLTADVFVRALRSLDQFRWQGKDFGAWLVTIARNLIFDHFKGGRYRLERATDPIEAGSSAWRHEDHDRRNDAEAVAVAAETAVMLDAALVKLTDEQRQVLALRFGAGLSIRETAQWLGCHEGAVKAMQTRACRALRRVLPAVPR